MCVVTLIDHKTHYLHAQVKRYKLIKHILFLMSATKCTQKKEKKNDQKFCNDRKCNAQHKHVGMVWFEQRLTFGLLDRLMNTLVISLWSTFEKHKRILWRITSEWFLGVVARNQIIWQMLPVLEQKFVVSYLCSILWLRKREIIKDWPYLFCFFLFKMHSHSHQLSIIMRNQFKVFIQFISRISRCFFTLFVHNSSSLFFLLVMTRWCACAWL